MDFDFHELSFFLSSQTGIFFRLLENFSISLSSVRKLREERTRIRLEPCSFFFPFRIRVQLTAIQDFMFLVHFLNNQAEHWFREIHLTEKSYYLNLPSVWLLRKIKEKNTNEFCLFSVYVVSVYW